MTASRRLLQLVVLATISLSMSPANAAEAVPPSPDPPVQRKDPGHIGIGIGQGGESRDPAPPVTTPIPVRAPSRPSGGTPTPGLPAAPIDRCQSGPNACPGTGGSSSPGPTAADAAYQLWLHDIALPQPVFDMPPGRAITGLDICMILSGPTTVTFDKTVFGYDVHVDATSVYDVDWGSNDNPPGVATDQFTHAYVGHGGYCDQGGTLRHQYTRRGPVNVTVTQRWTAHWRVGNQTGVIANQLHTSTTHANFPVNEVQAVVTIPTP